MLKSVLLLFEIKLLAGVCEEIRCNFERSKKKVNFLVSKAINRIRLIHSLKKESI